MLTPIERFMNALQVILGDSTISDAAIEEQFQECILYEKDCIERAFNHGKAAIAGQHADLYYLTTYGEYDDE